MRTLSVPAGSFHVMSGVEVMMSESGQASFVRDGRIWNVGAKPVGWFERVDWWQTAQRIPRLVDVQVWQVQARIGHNLRSPLVTFELVLGQDRETWTCRSISAIAA